MLPAVRVFIDTMRSLYEEVEDVQERWEKVRPHLGRLLADKALTAHSRTWPSRNDPGKGHYENLLFYEDPDYGFVINALIKQAGEGAPIHDHDEVWTLYGVMQGGETVHHYRRTDNSDPDRAALKHEGQHEVAPGYIDFVLPGKVPCRIQRRIQRAREDHRQHRAQQQCRRQSAELVRSRFRRPSPALRPHAGALRTGLTMFVLRAFCMSVGNAAR